MYTPSQKEIEESLRFSELMETLYKESPHYQLLDTELQIERNMRTILGSRNTEREN